MASPTFAVSKVYQASSYEIVHYDFYRLTEAGILEYELHDRINDANTVMIIEWGDIVQHILPDKRLTINIKVEADGTRSLLCSFPKELEYLLA